MMHALESALVLSGDAAERTRNLREANLNRDWQEALAPVLAWMRDLGRGDV
jgi:hypothetical protein